VNPILEAFDAKGTAFVRPVQVLPTKLEIFAELQQRVKEDERKKAIRQNLLAKAFPDKFTVDESIETPDVDAYLKDKGLPLEAFAVY
jgi:hypothetical protein